jgi:outer membrane receptor protein involved in Fe transport
MKFGYAFQSQRANGYGQGAISGNVPFSFLETAAPGATSFTSGSSFASFLLGAADSGLLETIRYLPQTYDYHGFYAQDDWRITKKLTLNIGLRYEFTLPPVAGGDQYSNLSPDTPNPAINNYPGALIFAGSGPGRTGKRSMVPGWYSGWGPHLGVAYAVNSKTTIRAGASRAFGRVTVVSGTTHYAGFIGQYSFASPNQGITPSFYLDQGFPSWPSPPLIDPAFANNNNVDWWYGQSALRAPEALDWSFSIQRELSNSMVFEADYHASAGTHLQSGNMNVNQVPMSIVS